MNKAQTLQNSFAGTLRLARLAWRRDRIRLSLWVVGIVALNLMMLPSLERSYNTPEERAVYASAMSVNMIGRIFGGVLDGNSMGAILMVEAFLFIAVLLAFMSSFGLMRHTRFNEELGATELMQSARVGRFAPLAAALLVIAVANIIIVIVSGVVMSRNHQVTPSGVWCYNIALGAVGLTFAGCAAVFAQLTRSTRSANMFAGFGIGASVLLRGLGDALGQEPTGFHRANSMWLSWLSPFGWAQQIYPFTRQHVWIFVLFFGAFCLSVSLAGAILKRRDVDAGLLPEAPGRDRAQKRLLSIDGLVWRLSFNGLLTWVIVIGILGAIAGAMSEQLRELLATNSTMQQYLAVSASANGTEEAVKAYQSYMLNFVNMIAVAFVLQTLLRLRSEESSGRLEVLLSTSISRVRIIVAYLRFVLIGIAVLAVLLGFCEGIAIVAVTNEPWTRALDITLASLAYIPATTVFVGLVLVVYAIAPSAVIPSAWVAFLFTFIVGQFGALLKLPHWIMSLSPFSHIPRVPYAAFDGMPLITLIAINIALSGAAILRIRSRNITPA